MAKNASGLIAGVDIGSSKVVVSIGRQTENGSLEVIGIGTISCSGLKRGTIESVDELAKAVQGARHESQKMANRTIHSVRVSLGGACITRLDVHGMVRVRTGEVGSPDVDAVLENACTLPLSQDDTILHSIPQRYEVDGHNSFKDPVGMSGARLDAFVLVLTSPRTVLRDIAKSVNLCGMSIDKIVASPLTSSAAVTTADDREAGVCVVDIGSATTEVSIYKEGMLRHSVALEMAGDSVTNDIKSVFEIPDKSAENLKVRYACAMATLAGHAETIRVPMDVGQTTREIARQSLAAVVENRYKKLFELVTSSIDATLPHGELDAGIVLTGGGARIEGITQLATRVLNLPVSLGVPENLSEIDDIMTNPAYSTCIGTLLYSSDNERDARSSDLALSNKSGQFLSRAFGWTKWIYRHL